MVNTTACLALSLLAQTSATEANPLPPLLTWKITSASLFRNGYAMVYREAVVPSGRQVVHLNGPGLATVGSLWFNTSTGLKVERIGTVLRESKSESDILNLSSLLHANRTKKLKLEVQPASGQGVEKVEGKVIKVLGDFVIIQTLSGERAIPLPSVRSVTAAEGFALKVESVQNLRCIQVNFTSVKGGKIYAAALQPSLTWSPSYSITLLPNKRLRLSAQTQIQNALASFKEAELHLVTGFPRLSYVSQNDPLCAATIAQSLTGLRYYSYDPNDNSIVAGGGGGFGGGGFGGGGAGVGYSAPIPEFKDAKPNEQLADSFGRASQGMSSENLFIYTLKGQSLEKSEVLQHFLFEGEGAYDDLYTCSLSAEDFTGQRSQGKDPIVWRSISFSNPIKAPLTPAPALILKEGRPLSHDELPYTDSGGSAVLKVALDPKITVKAQLFESSRRKVVKDYRSESYFGYQHYDEVILTGMIEAVSLKDQAVPLEVTFPVLGEMVESSSVEIVKQVKGLVKDNPNSLVTWRPKVDPGAKEVLNFKVQYTVNSYLSSTG